MRIYVGSLLWKYAIALPSLGYHFGGINGRLTVNSIQVSHFNYFKVLLALWIDTKHWYSCENHILLHLPQPQPHWNPLFPSPLQQPACPAIEVWQLFVFTKAAGVSTSTNGCSGQMHREIREMNFLLWVTGAGGEEGSTQKCPCASVLGDWGWCWRLGNLHSWGISIPLSADARLFTKGGSKPVTSIQHISNLNTL